MRSLKKLTNRNPSPGASSSTSNDRRSTRNSAEPQSYQKLKDYAKEKALKGFELYNEIEENAEGEVIKESTVASYEQPDGSRSVFAVKAKRDDATYKALHRQIEKDVKDYEQSQRQEEKASQKATQKSARQRPDRSQYRELR